MRSQHLQDRASDVATRRHTITSALALSASVLIVYSYLRRFVIAGLLIGSVEGL